jgi:hypothetical protein
MVLALAIAAALFGQESGPVAPAPAAPVKEATKDCSPRAPVPDSREVVVCVQKPSGFRIDPDVMAAKKARRQALAGRLKTPQEKMKDNSCTVVGAAGCVFDQPGINLLAAAATIAEISKRLEKGQEIGSIFVTDPQMSEYQYYQEAKKEREAKEAEKRVKAYAEKSKAAAQASAESTEGAVTK